MKAAQAAFWAAAERKKVERDAALRAEAAESELVQDISDQLRLKDELLRSKEEQLEDARRRVQALEEQLKAQAEAAARRSSGKMSVTYSRAGPPTFSYS